MEEGCTAFFFGTDVLPSKAEYYRSEDGCKTYQLVRTSGSCTSFWMWRRLCRTVTVAFPICWMWMILWKR